MDADSLEQQVMEWRHQFISLKHSSHASMEAELLPQALDLLEASLTTLELAQAALREKNQALQKPGPVETKPQQAQASAMELNLVLTNTIAAIRRFRVYTNRDWDYEYISPGFEKIFGYPIEALMADKQLWLSRIPWEDVENSVFPGYEYIFAEHTHTIKYRFHRPDDRLIWVSETVATTYCELTHSWVCTSVATDITTLKQAEAALQESEARYRNLVANIPGAVYRCPYTADGLAFIMSDGIEAIVGYPADEFLRVGGRRYSSMIYSEDVPLYGQLMQAAVNLRQPFTLEYRLVHADGSLRWVYERGQGVFDDQGDLLYLDGVIFDITDRKQAEEKIVSSLREKEVLLSEVHHRVKNNLQLISSMLELQILQASNSQAEEILQKSQSRINAIASVHENLYQAKNFAEINISDYTYKIATDLFNTYHLASKKISLQIETDPSILISLGRAIPCGLILNELVANALKHGLSQCQVGELRIVLTTSPAKQVTLAVINSGDGLPPHFEISNQKSLGLRLVTALAKQLGGKLEFERGTNTVFKVTFSLNPK